MSEDTISRQAAIDALKAIRYGLWEIDIPSPTVPEYVEHHEQIKNMMEITDGWIKKLEEQPTADVVERKRGKWIDETFKPWGLVHHPYKCDQCGEHSEADSDFCPNCGADMREEQDG